MNKTTSVTPAEAREAARKAYVYGFPMIENYKLMNSDPSLPAAVRFNRLHHNDKLAGPEDNDVVTPNNDTLYSRGWLDLRTEPLVLSIPRIVQERYWSFQFIDYFTNNFHYVGTRATGGSADGPQQYLIAGPGWKATEGLPAELTIIEAPSEFVFLLGRTQVIDGDLDLVTEIQRGYKITPLSVYLGGEAKPQAPLPEMPPVVPETAPTPQVFQYLNVALTFEASPPEDASLLAEMATIDVGPGMTFDLSAFPADVQASIQDGISAAYDTIKEHAQNLGRLINGWQMPKVNMPYFGITWSDYEFRAAIGYKGLYANSPEEALYPMANDDLAGGALTGEHRYEITFPKGQWPPADFFWSLTMYDANTLGLVPNELGRYSISDRTDGVVQEPETEALTFYLQHQPPGSAAQLANWLPAPAGGFYVVLRVYGPKAIMLTGEYGGYEVPAVTRVVAAR